MIDPSLLVDGLVDAWRGIPALVAEFGPDGGDATKIYAYHDRYPESCDLAKALQEMQPPAIMVFWNGTAPGDSDSGQKWKHKIGAYVRCNDNLAGDPVKTYYRLCKGMVDGILPGGLKILYTEIHEDCYPMDTPSINRKRAGITGQPDYFYFETAFTEKGDS